MSLIKLAPASYLQNYIWCFSRVWNNSLVSNIIYVAHVRPPWLPWCKCCDIFVGQLMTRHKKNKATVRPLPMLFWSPLVSGLWSKLKITNKTWHRRRAWIMKLCKPKRISLCAHKKIFTNVNRMGALKLPTGQSFVYVLNSRWAYVKTWNFEGLLFLRVCRNWRRHTMFWTTNRPS